MSDGGKTDFYDLKGCKDVDDLAEMLDLRGDEFNCLKAIFGIAIARKTGNSRHDGTSIQRDANKLAHYSVRIQERTHKPESELKGLRPSIIITDDLSDEESTSELTVGVGSSEHYHFIIEKLYEGGVVKTPYGRDYDKFLQDFINYIHEAHHKEITINALQFGDLAVIELV